MIITEIKHLNVRISEFEEPVFDANILPIFITPLILKEVDARKKSKYKIETLNPEKKLTFKIVSFNKIVEELAVRINKIAIDLEQYYYIDPSAYNSLPYKVKGILNKYKLKNDKKVIADASFRIAASTLKGKKHIIYARSIYAANRNFRRSRTKIYNLKTRAPYKLHMLRRKWFTAKQYKLSGHNRSIIVPIFNTKDIIKYRKLNFSPLHYELYRFKFEYF